MAGILGGEYMDEAALLLNDKDKITFTYAYQLPWFKRALTEFIDDLAKNSISYIINRFSSQTIGAGTLFATLPLLGATPLKVQERLTGSTFPYTDLIEVSELPQGLVASERESLGIWAWQGKMVDSRPSIEFVGASTSRDIIISYAQYVTVVDQNTDFGTQLTFNTKRAVSAKIAELINKFVLMNGPRGKVLFNEYEAAKDALIRIWIHKKQATPIRKSRYRR